MQRTVSGSSTNTASSSGAPSRFEVTRPIPMPSVIELLPVAAALRVARELGPGHVIVTVLCDDGAKYQSRLFNREWLEQKGLAAYALTPAGHAPITIKSALVA